MSSIKKASLFIPTFNAINQCSDTFKRTLDAIAKFKFHQVLVIDSSSTDNTAEVVRSYGFECKIIPATEFDHGGTRQLAAHILRSSDIIVYLTQDVLILDVESFTCLVQVLIDNEKIAGVYGRQLPHRTADIFACNLRRFNYTPQSYIYSYSDRFVHGMRCVFASDSFAAYRVSALESTGGFPDHVILGEDVYVFARFLQAGFKVAYSAEAICYHSHNYTIAEEFRRYFDIGVFHRAESWLIGDFGTASKDGIKYIIAEWIRIAFYPWVWPKAVLKTGAKYIGYKLGLNYDSFGVRLCRKFSMNKSFWW